MDEVRSPFRGAPLGPGFGRVGARSQAPTSFGPMARLHSRRVVKLTSVPLAYSACQVQEMVQLPLKMPRG